jgi:tyrosinase
VVNKDLWVKAATELRQPFWDWAHAEGPIPPKQIISMPEVEITQASGVKKFVENPFLAFKFPSKESRASFSGSYQTWETTLRSPINQGGKVVSSVDELKQSVSFLSVWRYELTHSRNSQLLARSRNDLRLDVYRALLGLKTWDEFSNRGKTPGGRPFSSLESVHDGIHVAMGNNGHMNSSNVAGKLSVNGDVIDLCSDMQLESVQSYFLLASLPNRPLAILVERVPPWFVGFRGS